MLYKAKGVACFLVVIFVIMITAKIYPFGFTEQEQDAMNLQTFVISDFGDIHDRTNYIVWGVEFSPFAVPVDYMSTNTEISDDVRRKPDPDVCSGEYIAAQPMGLPTYAEAKQVFSLGVKAQYIRQGYNWIELKPVRVDEDNGIDDIELEEPLVSPLIYDEAGIIDTEYGEGVITNLQLYGVVQSLDVWVWGGNYDYWLEFYLVDYKGYTHRIEAGDVDYVGWMNLRTTIPEYIPQSEDHVPFLQPLVIEKLKLWASPSERIDQFYAYFDYMQVQTDVYWERFNGDDLAYEKW